MTATERNFKMKVSPKLYLLSRVAYFQPPPSFPEEGGFQNFCRRGGVEDLLEGARWERSGQFLELGFRVFREFHLMTFVLLTCILKDVVSLLIFHLRF